MSVRKTPDSLLVRGAIVLAASVLVGGCGSDAQVESAPRSHVALRIVSLAPHLTELVYTAGAGGRLVGVVEYSDHPAAAAQLPRVGDAFRFDYELISSLKPDLVLGWTSGNPPEALARLRSLGLRVVEFEPRVLDDIPLQIERLGRMAGTEQVAGEAAARFRRELDELRSRFGGADSARVFFQVSVKPMYTVTASHVVGEIIELCGGANVFAGMDGLAPVVDMEAVIAADPEVIISTSGFRAFAAWSESWSRWQGISAVRMGALFAIDPDLVSRSGARILEGARQVCEAVDAGRKIRAGNSGNAASAFGIVRGGRVPKGFVRTFPARNNSREYEEQV